MALGNASRHELQVLRQTRERTFKEGGHHWAHPLQQRTVCPCRWFFFLGGHGTWEAGHVNYRPGADRCSVAGTGVGTGSLKILAGVLVHRATRPLRGSVSRGSGWSVPCVSIQLTLSQNFMKLCWACCLLVCFLAHPSSAGITYRVEFTPTLSSSIIVRSRYPRTMPTHICCTRTPHRPSKSSCPTVEVPLGGHAVASRAPVHTSACLPST